VADGAPIGLSFDPSDTSNVLNRFNDYAAYVKGKVSADFYRPNWKSIFVVTEAFESSLKEEVENIRCRFHRLQTHDVRRLQPEC